MQNEDYTTALNGDGEKVGFLNIVNEYGSTKAGKLAAYISTRCLSVSASVNRNNTEVLGERLYLVLEIAAILPIAVKQDQREAFSFLYIVVGDIH